MKHAPTLITLALALSVVAPFAAFSPAAARAADPAPPPVAEQPPTLGRNAALIYWQAFDALRQTMANEKTADMINQWNTVALDDKVAELLKDSTALHGFDLAGRIDACDWGIDTIIATDGPYTLLPHLSHARGLLRLVLLRARFDLEHKQSDKAVAGVLGAYRLARHVAVDKLLISVLVGIAIETGVDDFVADHFASFSDGDLKSLREGLGKLPPRIHIKATAAGERGFMQWMIRRIEKLHEKEMIRLLADLGNPGDAFDILGQTKGDKTKILALANDALKTYDSIAELLALPPDKFQAPYDQWEKQLKESKNPFIRSLLPAYGRSHHNFHAVLAREAILAAAITLRLEGEDAFRALEDPYGDGPFTLAKTDEGFTMSSKLADNGKAIGLTFRGKL